MVQKELLFFGLVAMFAIGGLVFQLQQTVTGNYIAGSGGKYIHHPVYVHFSPAEACFAAGYEPFSPVQVFKTGYDVFTVCKSVDGTVSVPLVQLVR